RLGRLGSTAGRLLAGAAAGGGARRVGERRVGRDLDVPLPRLLGDELPRDDFFDRARRALHLDAMVLLQERHDILAREVEKLRDFINPNCCQKRTPKNPNPNSQVRMSHLPGSLGVAELGIDRYSVFAGSVSAVACTA